MTEDSMTGVVAVPNHDVEKALAILNQRKDALLNEIVEQKAKSNEAMAKVKSARQELATVDRLLNATTPRKRKT